MSTLRTRQVRFDFSQAPLHWLPGDAQLTHTFNAFHLLLPAGERWFIEVFKEALPHVKDAALRQRTKAFMGQEETHARAHEAVHERLREQGLDPAALMAELDAFFEKVLAPRPFGQALPKSAWLLHRVSLVAAIEHMTCVLSTWLWANTERLAVRMSDEQMLTCLKWHAAEELEHRRIAFEVFRALGGRGWHRTVAMAEAFPLLTYALARGTSALMREDPTGPGAARWGRFFQHGAQGELPRLSALLRSASRYLQPGHDPHDEGEQWPAARAFLATYPGFSR